MFLKSSKKAVNAVNHVIESVLFAVISSFDLLSYRRWSYKKLVPNQPKDFIESDLHFVIVGLGHAHFAEAACRLRDSLRWDFVGANFHIINKTDVENFSRTQIAEIEYLNKRYDGRGYGLWLWKPIVVSNIMKKVKPDSLVIYIDSGCEYVSGSREQLSHYIQLAKRHDCVFFQTPFREHLWSSKESLELIVKNLDRRSGQIQATWFICKNTPKILDIMHEWVELGRMGNFYLLVGADKLLTHRHDQSLLSGLVKNHSLFSLPSIDHFHPEAYSLSKSVHDAAIHTLRNGTGTSKFPMKPRMAIVTIFKIPARFVLDFYRFINLRLKELRKCNMP